MGTEKHPVHTKVARLVETHLPLSCKMIKDKDCRGNQRIPLFMSEVKSRKTGYCNVDLLITKEGKIRAIIEIEESNVKPTQVCGKFLTSALARFYIHPSQKDRPTPMGDDVVFIQILDTSGLMKGSTSKVEQWKNLEKSLQSMLPVRQIANYNIISWDETSPDGSNLLLGYLEKL